MSIHNTGARLIIPEPEWSEMIKTYYDKDEISEFAFLFRRHRSMWKFVPNEKYGELCHITKKGTVYAIIQSKSGYKPIWIGRLSDGAWLTWERELRAESIWFSCGGRYIFPR